MKVQVYIEIEKDSNIKYELNKDTNQLEIDRILQKPYYYPYSYGFITHTLAKDNDELDALIITNKKLLNNKYYQAYIIGMLIMEDEEGMDEKILCVLEEDYALNNDICDLDNSIKDQIFWFFSNYKKNTPNKWSKVYHFENKKSAIQLYKKSCVNIL